MPQYHEEMFLLASEDGEWDGMDITRAELKWKSYAWEIHGEMDVRVHLAGQGMVEMQTSSLSFIFCRVSF